MTLEELKAMLEKGEITQEEYDAKVAELKAKEDEEKKKKEDDEKLQKLIADAVQRETDRVRTELHKKLKDREDEIENLKNEKLTDEEKAELERKKFEDDRKEFEKNKLNYETTLYLSEQKLPAKLVSYLKGSDLEKRKEEIKNLTELMDGLVQEKVKEKFNSQSDDFNNSNNQTSVKWNEMTIDEKIAFAEENPEEAKKFL